MFLLAFLACTPTLPAGASCTKADTCDEGLSCLPISEFDGSDCTDVSDICSAACEVDDDCAALGDGYVCFVTCDDGGTCAGTG